MVSDTATVVKITAPSYTPILSASDRKHLSGKRREKELTAVRLRRRSMTFYEHLIWSFDVLNERGDLALYFDAI